MSVIRKLAGDTAIYGFSTVAVRLINYALVPLHTRVFIEQSDYGIISEMYVYVAFLNVLFMYGMETAFFRFASQSEDSKKVFSTAQTSLLISTLFLSGALILFAQPIATALSYPEYPEFIRWFALIIGFDAVVNIPFAQLRLKSEPKKYATIKLLNVLTNVGLNIFFLAPVFFNKPELWSFMGYNYNPDIGIGYVFIANLVASTITLLIFAPMIIKTGFEINKVLWKNMFKYSWPLLIIGFAGMVNEVIDRVLLKYLLTGTILENLAQMGIYSAAYKLSIFMTITVQAFRMGVEPFFFNQAKQEDAKSNYALVTKFFLIGGGAIFLVVSLYLDVFELIIGKDFREGVVIVPILLLANLFLGLMYNLSVWYKVTDKTNYAIWISLLGAAVTITVNVMLIPIIGYWGSAIATLMAYMSMTVLSYSLGRVFYPIDYPLMRMGFYLVLMLVLFSIGQVIVNSTMFNEIASYALRFVLVAAYMLVVWLLEKQELKKAFAKA